MCKEGDRKGLTCTNTLALFFLFPHPLNGDNLSNAQDFQEPLPPTRAEHLARGPAP